MGLEEAEKNFKNEMLARGMNPADLKSWMRTYERTKKLYIQVGSRYQRNREDLLCVRDHLLGMEELMIGGILEGERRRQMQLHVKELKKFNGVFNHEFLISKEDVDWHMTYESLMKLAPKYLDDGQNGLILHSEIENLISLTNEALDRKTPDLFALRFF